jgi:uncharacterized RDD family membrane protein YckC
MTATAMLDTARSLPTPEGVELTLRLAGPVSRARAWLIDLFVRFGVFLVVATVLGVLGTAGAGLLAIAWFLLEWFYPVVFEVTRGGATPGKRMGGLAVLHDNGTPVGWSASVIRNLLRAVDFLPIGYAIGVISMLISPEFKRLGDLAAGTVVVYTEKNAGTAAVPVATPLAAPMPLKPDDQRAVIDFAERQQRWTPERAAELAELATPLVGGAHGPAATARLIAIANHLLGRK